MRCGCTYVHSISRATWQSLFHLHPCHQLHHHHYHHHHHHYYYYYYHDSRHFILIPVIIIMLKLAAHWCYQQNIQCASHFVNQIIEIKPSERAKRANGGLSYVNTNTYHFIPPPPPSDPPRTKIAAVGQYSLISNYPSLAQIQTFRQSKI